MSNSKGLFIVIEGIDGTGKSSQARLLGEALRQLGHTALIERQPSDGPHGTRLRQSMETGRLEKEEELALFLEDRRQHLKDIILPALERGEIVILDRYYFSNMAYQGARGFDIHEIRAKNETFAPAPDILFILDLTVDQALVRIETRGETSNEFEQRDTLEFCRNTFLSLEHEPYSFIIEASSELLEIHKKLLYLTLNHLS